MRGKTLKQILILSMFVILFFGFLSEFGEAATAQVEILGEPTYECYKKTSSGYFYHIYVTFYNSGDEISDEIDIMILENNKIACSSEDSLEVVFHPYETKSFMFNWSTVQKSKTLEIVYNPSSPNIQSINGVNSGSKSIIINYDTLDINANNTPGFEINIIIFSIVFYFIFILCFKKN